jgi:lipoprotein NlpI
MHRGTICFAAGKMAESVSSYDEAIRLQPAIEPRLWQRGLALYYADRFDDGKKQFETHQSFNSQDVENAVWHLLCAARLSDVETARKKLIPITEDTRVPMSQIYEMFAGRMTPEQVLERAEKTTATIRQGSEDHKLQLYFAHLYTGLYHEMLQDPVAAKASLKNATEINPLGKTNFMGQVARVHLMLREADKPGNESRSGKLKK